MKKTIFLIFIISLILSVAGCPSPGKIGKKMPRLFTSNFVMKTGADPSFIISEDFNRDG
jgi:hypothetical protein